MLIALVYLYLLMIFITGTFLVKKVVLKKIVILEDMEEIEKDGYT